MWTNCTHSTTKSTILTQLEWIRESNKLFYQTWKCWNMKSFSDSVNLFNFQWSNFVKAGWQVSGLFTQRTWFIEWDLMHYKLLLNGTASNRRWHVKTSCIESSVCNDSWFNEWSSHWYTCVMNVLNFEDKHKLNQLTEGTSSLLSTPQSNWLWRN